ncbi:hypothetical protein [Candidatus Endomicrobiellum trichonymphae]|nr:hypothetical protein [Candidatus Endomicrobium trichonymphae]
MNMKFYEQPGCFKKLPFHYDKRIIDEKETMSLRICGNDMQI